MQVFIRKPSIEFFPGIRVDKDTVLDYKNENVNQTLRNLVLYTVATIKGEGYESTQQTQIYLKEGDLLLFDDGGRGYIKPVAGFVTVAEAIEDLTNIKDIGGE
jgi:hypothetical protein